MIAMVNAHQMSDEHPGPSPILNFGDIFATNLWGYLDLASIVKFSTVCKSAEGMNISGDLATELLSGFKTLSLPDERKARKHCVGSANIAGLRKALYHYTSTSDSNSSFFDMFEKYSADIACFTMPTSTDSSAQDIPVVVRDLEKSSFDEFDDFVSRHPNPKQNPSHKRGDSLFNSDIEQIAEIARSEENISNLSDMVSLAFERQDSNENDIADGVGGLKPPPKRHHRARF